MKFNLSTSESAYNDKDKKQLEKLGFVFKKQSSYTDETGYIDGYIIIEINTLEELLEFQKNYGRLVISGSSEDGLWLEIYDGYRE